jgi:hypothetical protein
VQNVQASPHLNALLLLLLLQHAISVCIVSIAWQHITSRGPLLLQTLSISTAAH